MSRSLKQILGLVKKAANLRSASPLRPGKVAGLMPTRNYTDRCSAFEALSTMCDATIVLDDNSRTPFPMKDRCTEYIQIRNPELWNNTANFMLLLQRAFVHGYEWVVTIDDDLLMGSTFQTRADVQAVVETMIRQKLDICHFRSRELWERPDRYRCDGIWATKTFPIVRRNWFFLEGLTMQNPSDRLHSGSFPISHRARWKIHDRHIVYHTGCFTRADRQARVDKYRREDPSNAFQQDYAYMLDDTGLRLETVPPKDQAIITRRFHP